MSEWGHWADVIIPKVVDVGLAAFVFGSPFLFWLAVLFLSYFRFAMSVQEEVQRCPKGRKIYCVTIW